MKDNTNSTTKRKLTIYQICLMALLAALLCILAPLAVPVGPIPITLATMVIYFTVYVIGPWMGTGSVLIYILLGAVGLPVFSGGAGGFGKIAGPTGGYIIGYIFMALIGGAIIKATKYNVWIALAAWVVGTAVLYAFGTAWYLILTSVNGNPKTLGVALSYCVIPFLPGDAIKIVAGTFLGKAVRTALIKAHLIEA